jgi:hypothetical protein
MRKILGCIFHFLTTADIIQRMREAYANSRSYSDTGLVRTVFIYPDRRRTVAKPFKTAFIRPDQFRFEYRENEPLFGERRFIIFRKGKDLKIYSDLKLGMKLDSLDRAVAAVTGLSGGAAIRVPAMLLPSEIKWRRAIRFNKPKRIGDDRIAQIECFRIHDTIGGSPTTLWIYKEKLLLRKVYYEQAFDDFQVQTTMLYEPYLNQEVTGEMLDFNPLKIGFDMN